MRQRIAVLLTVCLVLIAGCGGGGGSTTAAGPLGDDGGGGDGSGGGGGGGDGAGSPTASPTSGPSTPTTADRNTRTPTTTTGPTTTVVRRLAVGATTENLTDRFALGYPSRLADRGSFTYEVSRPVVVDGRIDMYNYTLKVNATTGTYFENVWTGEVRIHRYYANGTTYRFTVSTGRECTIPNSSEPVDRVTNDVGTAVQKVVFGGSYDYRRSYNLTNRTRAHVYRAPSVHPRNVPEVPSQRASNASVDLTIDGDGMVRKVTANLTISGESASGRRIATYEFREFGETTVERPGWLDKCPDAGRSGGS